MKPRRGRCCQLLLLLGSQWPLVLQWEESCSAWKRLVERRRLQRIITHPLSLSLSLSHIVCVSHYAPLSLSHFVCVSHYAPLSLSHFVCVSHYAPLSSLSLSLCVCHTMPLSLSLTLCVCHTMPLSHLSVSRCPTISHTK